MQTLFGFIKHNLAWRQVGDSTRLRLHACHLNSLCLSCLILMNEVFIFFFLVTSQLQCISDHCWWFQLFALEYIVDKQRKLVCTIVMGT